MNTIETYSNWCEFDQLDGENIKNGEMLLIEFPDKVCRDKKVFVDTSFYMISDHGHPCEIPTRKAYIIENVLGMPSKIYIKGLKAKRIK